MTPPDAQQACAAALTLRRRSPDNLKRRVYRSVYAARWHGVGHEPGRRPCGAVDRSFVSWLTSEITAVEPVLGWSMVGSANDGLLIERSGTRAIAAPEQIIGTPQVGEHIPLRLPALLTRRIPGFVARATSGADADRLTRVYLNIKPPDARWVLDDIACALAAASIPFFMKVLAHPSRYYRTDAGLVMVAAKDERAALSVIGRCRDQHQIRLGSPTPLFTRRYAPGIGVADDPDDVPDIGGRRPSHGEWTTNLLLDAIGHADDIARAVASLEMAIRNAGRDPSLPYRRASTTRHA